MLESIGQFIYFTFAWAKDEKRSRRKKSNFVEFPVELLVRELSKRGRRVFTAVPVAAVYIYATLRVSGFLVSFNGEFTEVR